MSETEQDNKRGAQLSRRELMSKYGAYTAPIVISMLSPSRAYADMSGTPYSSITACTAAHPLNMSGMPMTSHCNNNHPIPP